MQFINNEWTTGSGSEFQSTNPATLETIWKGNSSSASDVKFAVEAARKALPAWRKLSIETRKHYLEQFQELLQVRQTEIARSISEEVGKPYWEALSEVQSMINKSALTQHAFDHRRATHEFPTSTGTAAIHYRPLGVVGVLGPFNFPGHIPLGQILPALLSGNTVVFKPSEFAPRLGEELTNLWHEIQLPPGVFNLVLGGKSTGQELVDSPEIDGLFFTGSYDTGVAIQKSLAARPNVLLALELGGNNPLIVHRISDINAAVYWTIQSAFLSAGQRCTCAQRLIVTSGNEAFLTKLVEVASQLLIAPPFSDPQPFYSCLINETEAQRTLDLQAAIVKKGGVKLLESERLEAGPTFLSPGILDVTSVTNLEDVEFFGPLLLVQQVDSLAEAIQAANDTDFGLVAAIFTDAKEDFLKFSDDVRAGLINWNLPTVGAGGQLPFGGLGNSGNHRPAGYFMIDACNDAVGMLQSEKINLPEVLSPGIAIT